MKPNFGDTVRILPSNETDSRKLSGLVGSVYGETTPSVSDVEVIGEDSKDYALNVHFHELDSSYWFVADLVEFVAHGEGMEMALDGVDKKWVQNSEGGWDEIRTKKARPNDMPKIIRRCLITFGVILALALLWIFRPYASPDPEAVSQHLSELQEPFQNVDTAYFLDGGSVGIRIVDAQGQKADFCLRAAMGDGDRKYERLYFGVLHHTTRGKLTA